MQFAYLINKYPKVSHTFIRREIHELERLGHTITRFTIRECRESLPDPLDQAEVEQTVVLLKMPACLTATLRIAVTRPRRFFRALRASYLLWRNAGQGIVRHLAYLAEACHLLIKLPSNTTHTHAHFGTNSASVAMLSHLLGGPKYSFTIHGPEEFERPITESLSLKTTHADFVVVISSFGKSQLERWCRKEDAAKIRMVRCGLADDYLHRPTTPVPDTNQLVCVARLSPEKGLLTLIEAVACVAKRGLDCKMILIGEGVQRPELEGKIEQAGLQDRVRLVGAQTGGQIQHWLETSRCFVLPSFAEGLPVVIMEAFAMARPVISTYVAAIPEIVKLGQSGWLFEAGSIEELSDAIEHVMKAPTDELYQMGQRGREHVLESHSLCKSTLQLAQLFADLRR